MIDRSLAHPRTQKIPKTTREKNAACASCRRRFPRRELVELIEDNHDGMAGQNGEKLCRPCADRMAVSF